MRFVVATIAACLAVAPALAAEPDFPALTGRVVDAADEIPAGQQAELEGELKDFETRTHHQMVVVTVPDLGGVPKEDYAYQIGRHWGIGARGRNDGIVLLQSPGDGKPGSGRLWIAVGYGLEGVLTDADTSAITRDVMAPILRQDRPRSETTPEAILAGARAVMKLASVSPEEKAAQLSRERAEAAQAHRRMVAGFWDFVLSVLGIGAAGGAGFGLWRLATRKERARRRAERAERDRIEAEQAAEAARQRAAEAARQAEQRRQAEEARVAEQRRQAEEAQRQRDAKLAAMTPAARDAFLADERRQAEETARLQREEAERQRQRDEEQRRRRREQEEADRRRRDEEDARSAAAASAAASTTSWSSDPSPSVSDPFSGGGGSFGGGGGGTDY
jgi:uncharacterized protein